MDGESKIPVIFHERVIKTRWSNGAYTCTVGPNLNFREEPKYLKEVDEKELSYHDKIKAEVFSCLLCGLVLPWNLLKKTKTWELP